MVNFDIILVSIDYEVKFGFLLKMLNFVFPDLISSILIYILLSI